MSQELPEFLRDLLASPLRSDDWDKPPGGVHRWMFRQRSWLSVLIWLSSWTAPPAKLEVEERFVRLESYVNAPLYIKRSQLFSNVPG
jgi:hypothetical protein